MHVSSKVELATTLQRCVLCDGDSFELLAQQDRHLLGLKTCGCRGCGLIQTNPRPDKTGLATFYEQDYRRLYQNVTHPDEAYVNRFGKGERLRHTVAYLQCQLPLWPNGVLLDYGCGEGSLFAAMRAAGYRGRLVGVEQNARFAKYAANVAGAEVNPTVDAFYGLDVVILNHVLEHLGDPVGVLGDLRKRMVPDGLLYVDVPDADRYTSVSDLHIAHLLHFNKGTLMALVEAAGFQVLSCEAHDPPYHPRSLRLLAHVSATAKAAQPMTLPDGATWRRVRVLDRQRWRWVVAKHLADMGPLRRTYRVLHRLVHSLRKFDGH